MGLTSSRHAKTKHAQYKSKKELPYRHWVPYPAATTTTAATITTTATRATAVGNANTAPSEVAVGRVVRAVDLTSVLRPCANLARLSAVRWWVDCQFLPYDDSKLMTCISLHEMSSGGHQPAHLPPCTTNGVINIWNLGNENRGCITEIHRRTSLHQPHCQMTPDGGYVCYLETSGIVMRSIHKVQQHFTREAFFKSHVYHFCDMSPDEMFIATITRQGSAFQLYVFSTPCFYSYKGAACRDLFPAFPDGPGLQVECRFSPDSRMIAVSTSPGHLYVAARSGPTLHRAVLPGICGRAARLAGARTFDFDPRFGHEALAVCTTDRTLAVADLATGRRAWRRELPEELGEAADSLKYNQEGNLLAVAGSEAAIGLFHSASGEALLILEGADQCVHFAMRPLAGTGRYPSILRMSFTHNASHLAAASTDGFVRIWRLPHTSTSLQSLCRLKILRHVPLDKVGKLPLPARLCDYILCSPIW